METEKTCHRLIMSLCLIQCPTQLSTWYHSHCFQVSISNQIWEFFPPKNPFYVLNYFSQNDTIALKEIPKFLGKICLLWADLTPEIGKVKQGTRSCSPCISLSSFTRWFRKRALSIFQNLSVSPINKQTQGDIQFHQCLYPELTNLYYISSVNHNFKHFVNNS